MSFRAITVSRALLALAICHAGCAGAPSNNGQAGSDGASPTAGAVGEGGTMAGGSGGTSSSGGNPGMPQSAVGDDGKLFTDAGPVVGLPPGPTIADAGTTEAGLIGGSAGTATKMYPALMLTMTFTQKGTDVTMAITHKGCSPVSVQIHAGYACDNASTYGGIWDRNGNITGNTVCDAAQLGTLTYTRSGSDPALAWTVGDHSVTTDVTFHAILVDGNCHTFF